ncbi:Lrp/AsnC family transcriptional regulator [Aquipuribacter nitratireducens]|uniref:Lrp/AsnC family transcriptional regulator n=1 Tax=Aquipuribacter nitratireducens TaxID=650104 RepID=A0ABW0GR30_9MICO
MTTLDGLDERILAILRDDGRASFAVVGERVGLSASAVKRRVDRLREAGVITGFAALVDPEALGWTTEAYVELWCAPSTTPAQVLAVAARHPQVVSAATISGEADALVHVRATSVHDFERVLERIGADPSVVRTKSAIVLSRGVQRS